MDTITFESLGGAPTEQPDAIGLTDIGFFAAGVGEPLTAGLGYTDFGFSVTMGGAAPEAPIVPGTLVMDLPFSIAYSFGPEAMVPATGETDVGFSAFGFGAGAYGATVMAFEPFGVSYNENDVAPPPSFSGGSQMAEQVLVLSESMTLLDTAVMNIVLSFRAAISSEYEGEAGVAESLLLAAALDAVYYIAVAQGISLATADTATPRALERVVETMLLAGLVETQAEALSAIIEALAAADAADAVSRAEVLEQVALAGVVSASFRAASALVEQLSIGASIVNTGTMVAAVNESMALDDAIATELEAFEAITEGLAFVLRLHLDTGEYIAWSLGTTNKQLSKYTNYPCNSFAKLGRVYLGCTDEGIFQLDGTDDDGEQINARLRGALTDMGTLAMKRNTTAYLAYSAPTGLILRTITTTKDGDKVAHTYRLKAQPAGAIREGRIKLGGGVASMMWGWEIENVDGGPLELHALQFKPIVLERKMRGKNGGT